MEMNVRVFTCMTVNGENHVCLLLFVSVTKISERNTILAPDLVPGHLSQSAVAGVMGLGELLTFWPMETVKEKAGTPLTLFGCLHFVLCRSLTPETVPDTFMLVSFLS